MRTTPILSSVASMGYPPRDELPGAYYHVGTRGNNQRDIYTDDRSRLIFLLQLQLLCRRYGWQIVAYCLMINHYHLVMRIGHKGLSRGMQSLNSGYAHAFNQRAERRDHLFGRRFWSRELADLDDVIGTCVYVDLNPTRSFDIAPQDWRWSGYRATIGLDGPTGFHQVQRLWRLVDTKPRGAMDSYGELVRACL